MQQIKYALDIYKYIKYLANTTTGTYDSVYTVVYAAQQGLFVKVKRKGDHRVAANRAKRYR